MTTLGTLSSKTDKQICGEAVKWYTYYAKAVHLTGMTNYDLECQKPFVKGKGPSLNYVMVQGGGYLTKLYTIMGEGGQ